MAWVLAWLIFGLLAAYEAGELAMHASNEWGSMRALAYLLGSVVSLCVIAAHAIRRPAPSKLRAPIAFSLAALLACFWALYGSGQATSWTTAAMFGAAYSLGCLVACCVLWLLAWRRHRVHHEHVAQAHADHDRNRRMESIRAQTSALAAAAANSEHDPLGADSDFELPARPKWEDS